MTTKTKSIAAAEKLIAKKGALTAAQINAVLKARGLQTLTSTELVNNFDKAAIKGNPKNKYAYTKKQKTIIPVKKAAKAKPAKKCTKACKSAKKPVKKLPKKLAKDMAKTCDKVREASVRIAKAVVDGMTAPGRYRTIEMPDGVKVQVDIVHFNNLAAMSNCISLNPHSMQEPGKWVFLAGKGEWPDTFRGIDVHVNPEATGVLLVRRSMIASN